MPKIHAQNTISVPSDPASSNDLVDLSYLNTQLALKLSLTGGDLTGQISTVPAALSIVSGLVAVDCSRSNFFTLDLTQNVTLSAMTNVKSGGIYKILIRNNFSFNSGTNTVTFDASYKFPGGTVPTVSTGNNVIDLLTVAVSPFDTTKSFSSIQQNFH